MQETLFGGAGKRLLLIASTGGHLRQLIHLARREQVAEDSLWVTFDSPQSRSLLQQKPVLWSDYVAPRDLSGTLKLFRKLNRELDATEFDGALSTGAAVAVSGMLWARLHRVPGVYVESISRTEGPSLSGRIIGATGLATTYTQHEAWASQKWRLTESVLADFARTRSAAQNTMPSRDPEAPLRVLVTLGTIRPYRFDRLVDQVIDIVRPQDHIIWQLGETARDDLPGESHRMLDNDELMRKAMNVDVVITHSGVGTILELLERGVSPIVVPRRSQWNEHVDDHQLQIFEHLHAKGIAHPVEVPELTREVLTSAASGPVIEYEGWAPPATGDDAETGPA